MAEILATLWRGVQQPFRHVGYWALFFSVMFGTAALFLLIPALTVVGNSIRTQLSLLTSFDWAVITGLSLLYALFVVLWVYVIRKRHTFGSASFAVGGGAGTLFAGVAGTAFCASCLAPLFALFGIGFGGVLFVLEYRFYFVTAVVVLMLAAIYFSALRIAKLCKIC